MKGGIDIYLVLSLYQIFLKKFLLSILKNRIIQFHVFLIFISHCTTFL